MKIFFSNLYHSVLASWHRGSGFSCLHDRDTSGCTYHMMKARDHMEKII